MWRNLYPPSLQVKRLLGDSNIKQWSIGIRRHYSPRDQSHNTNLSPHLPRTITRPINAGLTCQIMGACFDINSFSRQVYIILASLRRRPADIYMKSYQSACSQRTELKILSVDGGILKTLWSVVSLSPDGQSPQYWLSLCTLVRKLLYYRLTWTGRWPVSELGC